MGYYSHGPFCLTHQHWVEQVVSAGGFNVHCVQAAEASHKINMHLAAARVRHSDINQTQNSMLKYLTNRVVFTELDHFLNNPKKTVKKKQTTGAHATLYFQHNLSGPLELSDRFLHSDIRLSELEFAKLVLKELQMEPSDATFQLIQSLSFVFSQRFVREDGLHLWATDKELGRRDIYNLCGVDKSTGDSLCAEAVCFVDISGLQTMNVDLEDSKSYVLVRWLQPHPDSFQRDDRRRPCCPGPLHINNCLWQYAKLDHPRSSLSVPGPRNQIRISPAFTRDRRLFGSCVQSQNKRRIQELYAWYTLIVPENIYSIMNMCPVFQPASSESDSESWLQTVTMY